MNKCRVCGMNAGYFVLCNICYERETEMRKREFEKEPELKLGEE